MYLQTLLFFDLYYTYLLCLATLALNTFKLYALPYPQGYWSIEILILIIYLFLALTRISYGMIGNRIESSKHIGSMISLSIFAIFCNLYFVNNQTYILKVEVILHIVAVVFTALEVMMGFIGIISYK